MHKRLARTLTIDGIILFVIAVSAAILDVSLALGKFHGFVFALYTVYGGAGIFLVNSVLWGIALFRKKHEAAWQYLVAGLATLALGFVVAWLGGKLFTA